MNIITLKLSVTNCFLIKGQEKYVLIDTGYEEDWELFLSRLKEVNVSVFDISHIILTHHHDDHCGLLNKIITENNNIKVVMSHLAKDLLLKGKNDQSHGVGILNRRVKLLLSLKQIYIGFILRRVIDKSKNLTFVPYNIKENDILVKGETSLKAIGIDFNGKIIETPGHTVDSISVIFDDGDAVVGDAAANFLKFAGTKYCVIGMYSIEEYYKSWEKIISEDVKIIYPAHGKKFLVDKLKENIGKNKKENMIMR